MNILSILNNGLRTLLAFNQNDWQKNATLIIFIVLSIAVSYLLGSVNSAIIISKLLYKDDIRKHGSGNAGMTNMLRTYGKGAAALTLLGDMMKTALALLFTGFLLGFNYIGGMSHLYGYCYLAGLFAVLGHVFPIYYGFKGGKGVLVTATMALILTPVPFLVLLALFIAIVAMSKYVSLGSVSVAVLYPVVVSFYSTLLGLPLYNLIAPCCILLAIFIVWCHRANLKRIGDRTENKISFKKVKKEEND